MLTEALNTQRESTYSVAGDVATLTINGFEESMLRYEAFDIVTLLTYFKSRRYNLSS